MTKILSVSYSAQHDAIILETSAAESLDEISVTGEGLPPGNADAQEKKHIIYLRPEAVADRMAFYDLNNEKAALEAIVKEHIFRHSELEPKDSKSQVHLQGGIDDRIGAIEWHENANLSAIEGHKDRIKNAHKQSLIKYASTQKTDNGVLYPFLYSA